MMFLYLLFLFPLLAQSQDKQDYIPWLLERLESQDGGVRNSSYTALLSEKDSVTYALKDFAEVAPISRELRAALILERGEEKHVSRVIELLQDSDSKVRSLLIRFLSRSDLGSKTEPSRVQALYENVRDEDFSVAELALQGLSSLEDDSAGEKILELIQKSSSSKIRELALQSLIQQFNSTQKLLALLKVPEQDVFVLKPVMTALASRGVFEVLPYLLVYIKHPDPRLSAIAKSGFSLLQWKLIQKQDYQRAAEAYRIWNAEETANPETLLEELGFLLDYTEQFERARKIAQSLDRKIQNNLDRGSLDLRVRAAMWLGWIDLLQKHPKEAELSFQKALKLAQEIFLRVDLIQEPDVVYFTEVLRAKAHLLRAWNAVANPSSELSASDLPDAKFEVRAAYDRSQQAQEYRDAWLYSLNPKEDPDAQKHYIFSFDDEILSNELGFYSLVRESYLKQRGIESTEKIWQFFATSLSKDFPMEFVPLPPEKLGKPSPFTMLNYRYPSQLPYWFSEFYSMVKGDSQRALEILLRLSEQWRLRLNEFDYFSQNVAKVEFRIASLYMDQHLGAETEKFLRRGISLLQDLDNVVRARTGQNEMNPQLKSQLSSAYVSLAVNENVVNQKPLEAKKYLEQAYQLEASAFNRVLLACYQARAGERDTARRVLTQVEPDPSLFYNIACTYALLGEKEAALRFLQKHFESFADLPGQQKQAFEWAKKDPDLESLRETEEFKKLIQTR